MSSITLAKSFSFTQAQDWNWVVTQKSSTQITISDGTHTQVFGGAFTFSTTGAPSGTVTTSSYSENGELKYSVTGMNSDAARLHTHAETFGDTDQTYAYVFQGNDTLTGSTDADVIYAYAGNDVVTGGKGNDSIDGGTGTDKAVYAGTYSNYSLSIGTASVTVADQTAGRDGTDSLANVERLVFSDKTIALDTGSIAGQAYRIYQAAFNRTPDASGLGYWINAMDNGASLLSVAQGFVGSAEFASTYGSNPSVGKIVGGFYNNVLHRDGESSGVAYWTGVLTSGAQTAAQVLMGFSESTENQVNLTGVMQSGIQFQPWAG